MSDSPINITLKLFAAYQEAYGVSQLQLTFPPQTTVSQVLQHILTEHPELQKWQEVTKFGINFNFVSPETILQDGDEVVFIPPVSGGLSI
ncbi:MAG: MoaD/ThiS family protein [Microcoleaceae cyanobacterium MO_207.B10]|nr:MoaD/ThiS family protein [Microcoleaceae cyanobacterium MO_207.B10]